MEQRPAAQATLMIDNDEVLVTEWRFAPNAETGWHRHQCDYVVVPQSTGTLRLEENDGERTAELISGQPYFRNSGVVHNVVNANDYEFVFIEVEIKNR